MRSALAGAGAVVAVTVAALVAPRGGSVADGAAQAPAAAVAGRLASATGGPQVPVAAAATRDGRGFWVASTDGAVVAEGDAQGHGDASATALAAPVVSIAATPTGGGYWLLGGDGGVFSYGDAAYHGSTVAMTLAAPALQVVATADGGGYWFVARDGGVFSFGDARFFGSTGATRLNQPVVGMAATPDGGGYWLVARDGGVFAFGDARFLGAPASGHPSAPAIGMVATGDGGGYWVVLADGSVLPFGDAPATGTPIPSTAWSLVGQVVTVDPGHNGGNAGDPSAIDAPVPSGLGQTKACDTVGASTDAGYPEHAFTFDLSTRLATELRQRGATVVLTRPDDTGVGPCVDRRAEIGNQAGSDAAISVHGDGGPPGGRGYAVLEPDPSSSADPAAARASAPLGSDVAAALQDGTPLPPSTYDGSGGIDVRSDLGGLNLSTVPKVLVEVGNMRNATDAGLETAPAFRQQAAVALADGLSTFLVGGS
ncbi:MAG TPA: N-acetylmuramoyl-L-alanine amidase [Acidimicrobiales bacterium]|nr:N-acetylmuramoyl-L-alanine amidase [Acidimicrobiales bacterium]